METLLIGVAVVSLVLASTMGVVAWRLLRGDRQRSRARVELLAALAAEPDASPDVIASDIAAAAPAPPAFADALVVETTTFRASVPAPEPARLRIDLPVRDETVSVDDVDPVDVIRPSQPPQPDVAPAHVSSAELFAAASTPRRSGYALVAIAALVTVVAVGAVGAGAVSWPSASAATETPGASVTPPIELLSLRHSLDEPGYFTVTGLVRGPVRTRIVRPIVAVVYLFDEHGQYFASGRGALERPALDPGEEAPFVIRVPTTVGVSRYRIGFRLEDGGVVGHLDQRTVTGAAGPSGQSVPPSASGSAGSERPGV
jgi:hypothetical protein